MDKDKQYGDASSLDDNYGLSDAETPAPSRDVDVTAELPIAAMNTAILGPPIAAMNTSILERPIAVMDTSILEPPIAAMDTSILEPLIAVMDTSILERPIAVMDTSILDASILESLIPAAGQAPTNANPSSNSSQSDAASKNTISSGPSAPLETPKAADWAARVNAAFDARAEQYCLPLAGAGLQPPRDLPPRASGFVGRERELAELRANLRAGQATELSAALAGLGGVGKSALASEAVWLLAGEPGAFPGGIAFVRCDGRTGLEGLAWVERQLLDAWKIALSPEQLARAATSAGVEVEVREQALRQRLRALLQPPIPPWGEAASGQMANAPLPTGAAALVFLDNVEPRLPIDRLLDTLSAVGVTALVTARHPLNSSRVRTQRLETLAPDAARALFRERYTAARRAVGLPDTLVTPPSVSDAVAREAREANTPDRALDTLTALAGYLPLAIELAAARAGRLGLAPMAAAQELQQARRRSELLLYPRDPTKSLEAALDKSLIALTGRQQLRFAALALPQGADWPRATIELFLSALDIPHAGDVTDGTTADAAPRARQDAAPDEAPDDAAARASARADLDALVSLSLVTLVMEQVDEGQYDVRVRVHPLLRERAQREWEQWFTRCATLRQSAAWALVDAVRETALPYATQAQTYSRLDIEEALVEGALATLAAVDNAVGAQRLVAKTVGELETYWYVGARWRLGARLSQMQLAARRKAGDRGGEGVTLNNLGLLADRLGQPEEARHYYEQALAVLREVGDRGGEGTTLNNLGSLADHLGQPEEARRYSEQALTVLRKVGDRGGEGVTLNNLGLLADRLGQPEEARRYYEQALAIWREVGDRGGEGTTLNNLGLLVDNMGQSAEARRYYEQALATWRKVGDRGGEGTTFNNLGLLARSLGRPEEARRYYEQALAILREVGDRATEGVTLNNLGSLARSLGRPEEARRYYEQALTILEVIGMPREAQVVQDNLATLAVPADTKVAQASAASARKESIQSWRRSAWGKFWDGQ